ncbi:hypothetical protein SKAU_G00386160 [Synaphobranchus kaupii]|uniref:Uncharacterized protein n=1 Tax=Synaphobranchus kaupii TaxID=118154 RepID=A0A9Q1IF97_SYNKA|nr:hypothetical protein SKAU_G00386160 [Synaphobranchus kaupii]
MPVRPLLTAQTRQFPFVTYYRGTREGAFASGSAPPPPASPWGRMPPLQLLSRAGARESVYGSRNKVTPAPKDDSDNYINYKDVVKNLFCCYPLPPTKSVSSSDNPASLSHHPCKTSSSTLHSSPRISPLQPPSPSHSLLPIKTLTEGNSEKGQNQLECPSIAAVDYRKHELRNKVFPTPKGDSNQYLNYKVPFTLSFPFSIAKFYQGEERGRSGSVEQQKNMRQLLRLQRWCGETFVLSPFCRRLDRITFFCWLSIKQRFLYPMPLSFFISALLSVHNSSAANFPFSFPLYNPTCDQRQHGCGPG